MTTEQVARFAYQTGSFEFKVLQAASHYPLPELRQMLREAESTLYALRQDPDADRLEIDWWQEWAAILKQGIERRLIAVLNSKPVQIPNGRPHLDINMVKERSDIVSIVERHIELKPMGRVLKGLCPFHSEKTPSFHVWPEQNRYHCFGCNASGSVLDFVMRTQNLNLTDGLHFLADQAGIQWPEAPKPKRAAVWSTEI